MVQHDRLSNIALIGKVKFHKVLVTTLFIISGVCILKNLYQDYIFTFTYQALNIQSSELRTEIHPNLITDNSFQSNNQPARCQIQLNDIYISVKTSRRFHASRIEIILKTWFPLAAEETYFVSDFSDPLYDKRTNGHMIFTNCIPHHRRSGLSCKMGIEYDSFMKANKKWWCHFDDDNYVNVKQLTAVLSKFSYESNIYLGKASLSEPISTMYGKIPVKFRFATGGAGICISRALAIKMLPWSSKGKFVETSIKLNLPDDCTLGFIITNLLGVNITYSSHFHSHLESLKFIKKNTFMNQVSFSYFLGKYVNVVDVDSYDSPFNFSADPTRILSLHCVLYPKTKYCNSL